MQMGRQEKGTGRPNWDLLYDAAAAREGHFTTDQAARAGYSPQLLHHYVELGRITRVRHGIYRLVHFPPGDHEDLVAVWMWDGERGVFWHETALALTPLSDVLPARVHVTLPPSWQGRRLRVPSGVVLWHAQVSARDRVWIGPVPCTSPLRTLRDCVDARSSPETIGKAVTDARARGLITRAEEGEFASLRNARSDP